MHNMECKIDKRAHIVPPTELVHFKQIISHFTERPTHGTEASIGFAVSGELRDCKALSYLDGSLAQVYLRYELIKHFPNGQEHQTSRRKVGGSHRSDVEQNVFERRTGVELIAMLFTNFTVTADRCKSKQ